MRALSAVVLCFVVGACATFGGGEPDIYGVYDLVSDLGRFGSVDWYYIELKEGPKYGIYVTPRIDPEMTLTNTTTGLFRVAEEKVDGCLQLELASSARKTPATLCGDVLTRMDGLGDMVFHKRR